VRFSCQSGPRLRAAFDHESRGVLRGFGINVLRLESSCRDLCGFATHRVIQRLSVVGAHGVAARDKKRQDVQGQLVGGKLNPTFRREAEGPLRPLDGLAFTGETRPSIFARQQANQEDGDPCSVGRDRLICGQSSRRRIQCVPG